MRAAIFGDGSRARSASPSTAEGLEIVERRAPRLLAVHLLGDVSLQVSGQARGDGIVPCQHARAFERGLHERHERACEGETRRQIPRQ